MINEEKENCDIIIILEKNIDSYAAGEIIHKKMKDSKKVVYRKSIGFYTFIYNLIKEYSEYKLNFHCISFVPSLKAVQTLKEEFFKNIKGINVYINADVTGAIIDYLDIIKSYPLDMSVSSYLALENNHTVTPMVNLLDIFVGDSNNVGKLVLKLTPFSHYEPFITDRSKDSVDKVSYASKILSNHIKSQSKIKTKNITFHIIDGETIPFINTIQTIKHKVLENIMIILENNYPIVGTYQIQDRGTVSISLLYNGKGGKTAKEIAEKFDGSGSVFKSGFYYPLKDFFDNCE